jgi:hypothetical protein
MASRPQRKVLRIYIPGRFNKDKSKLFFFVDQDFKQLRQGATNTWTVPTLCHSPAFLEQLGRLSAKGFSIGGSTSGLTSAPNCTTSPSIFPIRRLAAHTQAQTLVKLLVQRTRAPYNGLSA